MTLQIGIVYGNPEVTTGGNALKYWCSVRLEVRRIKTLEGSDGEQVGIKVRAKVGPLCTMVQSCRWIVKCRVNICPSKFRAR